MTSVRLDPRLYPPPVVARAIADYRELAAITPGPAAADAVVLEVTSRGPYAEALVVDEFLNYLLALTVKTAHGGAAGES